jgi:ligand-binding SRPBCC domain-containing protein
MAGEPLRFTSELQAAPDAVWAAISTMDGVNYELAPLVRMTCPREAGGGTIEQAPLGTCAFHSYLLLLGVLPFDRHALTLLALQPGDGFVEDSTSLLQRRWRHERRIRPTPAGGCRITDELLFVPRIGLLEPLVCRIVQRVFTHRHRRLRQRFGDASRGGPLTAGR